MNLYEFQRVSKSINKIPILTDLSFELEAGTGLALLGGNGSGKTMLLRLFAGLIRPTHGRILYRDQVLGRDLVLGRIWNSHPSKESSSRLRSSGWI